MMYKRNKEDSCLMNKWVDGYLVVWMTWVDVYLTTGPDGLVKVDKEKMMSLFQCEELGEVDEYVGFKIDYDQKDRSMSINQPVLLQSYKDEFNLDEHGKVPKTLAEAGSLLRKGEGEPLNTDGHKKYCTGAELSEGVLKDGEFSNKNTPEDNT
eukprot:14148328-Ditylum_brightwellii.AAC.1